MTLRLFEYLAGLAEPTARVGAANDLARALGADEMLLLVRDPELNVPLPAPGFPQTLRGGPSFRQFLRERTAPGEHRGEVEYPTPGEKVAVVGFVCQDGTTALLFGGAPDAASMGDLARAMPLIGALLRAENAAKLSAGEAAVARAAGRRAHELTLALDAARADLEHALGDAARLNAQLQETDRRKDEFLAMLGHELRNPMAAITAALELMRVREGDPEHAARARAIIGRQSRQLSYLIDDLLDVARITRGTVSLRLEDVDVMDVARRSIETTSPLFASKSHVLRVHDGGAVLAKADPVRLEQMITNLLTNAAKFTAEGGDIDVAVSRQGDEAVIAIRDSGIGIAKEMLPRIFELFVQVAPSIDRAAGGLGVGLTLVSRLAALHGGRAEATSEPGKGSEFVLRIPAAEAPLVRASEQASSPPAAAAAKRVLIVDDNLDSAEMVAMLVSVWGHEPRQAHDGVTALGMAESFYPDVVLLDIGLPGIDGYEVARKLRQMPATHAARIIAVSGYGLESDRVKSREAGFDLHVVKPIDFAALERALRQ